MRFVCYFILLLSFEGFTQNINVNNNFENNLLRNSVLSGKIQTDYTFNIKPISIDDFENIIFNQNKTLIINDKKTVELKFTGIDFFTEYNSNHPYNRNNGTMIPNKGYQHIISPGFL